MTETLMLIGYAVKMEYVSLAAQRQFSNEKMQKIPLFNSDKMFIDQYCLQPGQMQKVHSHYAEDKVYVVLQGEAMIEIDGEQELLTEGMAVIARAGIAHGVRNDSANKVVLLVVMAPRPHHHA
jgi:mannose-6-phosphate isomerase-like protein (cupin superfamily)